MVCTCTHCHYTFESAALPGRCPDCGKQAHGVQPAVRVATSAEIADYERIRLEIMEEEQYSKLEGHL